MTRREAALAAAAKLGRPTAETQKAIEENRAFYEQRRAARAEAAVEPLDRRSAGNDRRTGDRRLFDRRASALLPQSVLNPEPAVKAVIDARAASGDPKRFTGELPSGFGDLGSLAFV